MPMLIFLFTLFIRQMNTPCPKPRCHRLPKHTTNDSPQKPTPGRSDRVTGG